MVGAPDMAKTIIFYMSIYGGAGGFYHPFLFFFSHPIIFFTNKSNERREC
jgi:hypothetical protein